MSWKLWLDDQLDDPALKRRHTPPGFIGAKSSWEALELIKVKGMPEFIDFDFDLGGTDTAQSFLYSLQSDYPNGPIPDYRVHSRNPYAESMIKSFIESWKKTLSMDNLSLVEAAMECPKNN